VVQTQDPRLQPSRFDMVVAPAHDDLSGDNVFEIVGSPHRITPALIAEAATDFEDRISPLPHPRVAVMIGGKSKAFDLTEAHAAELADQIADTVSEAGGSLLLTFSRRTPQKAKAVLSERLSGLPGMIWDGEGANPLFAFLDAADHILVTEDSANMAAEAASTGKPVHVLPMMALKPPGKFARLHADLEAHGATRPFYGMLESWTYEPLAETDRAARAVLDALSIRRAAAR
jgi:mitochondrial fission protein ELM1